MSIKRIATIAIAVLTCLAVAAPATAKPAPVTKIRFKLDDHEVMAGEDITGSVHVWTRDGNAWVPLEGAVLKLLVDGVEKTGILSETDDKGFAAVSYEATEEGDHVMKVVFEGTDTHKRAQRAQGFEVSPAVAPPPAPTEPTVPEAPVLTATPGTGVVSLSWTVPANGGSPILGYAVFRKDALTGTQTLNVTGIDASTTAFGDASATPGTAYSYQVAAVNAIGQGPWSDPVVVTAA